VRVENDIADFVDQRLTDWKASLLRSIPVGGLLARSPVAHKWKAPFRSMMLREAVFWRLHDLLSQSYFLYQQQQGLGARILLRSAFESLASLIYLNSLMERVLQNTLNFHEFSAKSSVLLLGSRNDERGPRSVNIITVLEKCEARYPGLMAIYADLSESAHPSHEGLCVGYSVINYDEYETNFSNRWMEIYGAQHLHSMKLCMATFDYEYDDMWSELFIKLERWIEANDAELEATK
jgi:hypothetical protein